MTKTIGENEAEARALLEETLKKVQAGTESIGEGFYRLWDFLHLGRLNLEDVVARFKEITPKDAIREIKDAVCDYGDFRSEVTAMLAFGFRYENAAMVVGKMVTEDEKRVFEMICSPMRIRGLIVDAKTRRAGTLVSIKDRFDSWRDVVLYQSDFWGDGDKWVKKLTDAGLKIVGKVSDVKRLLHLVDSQKKITTVDQIGWQEGEDGPVFVFPNKNSNGSNRMFSGDMASYHHGAKGSLEDWKQQVASFGEENSRLGFAICVALAAPLLKPLGIESGGFHLVGDSSRGKTTALQVGASVWGKGTEKKDGYIKSWRSTDNAMEAVAYRHNDVFLAIDEIGEADKTLGATVYMLANGGGKDRMKASTEARPTLTWRTMFLSTGEKTIADKIESEGKKATGGQAVRVVDVPSDAGKGHFLYDSLPSGLSGKELTTKLKANACRYFGTGGPAFVEFVIANYATIADSGRDLVEKIAAVMVPPKSDGQVERVATRFALLAYAGELAIEAGILPWKQFSAVKIAQRCFDDWLKARGTNKGLEPKKGADAVLKFITAHGNSRFQDEKADGLVINRVGFKVTARTYLHTFIHDETWQVVECDEKSQPTAQPMEVTQYWIDNQCWSEVCGGNSPVQTARQLKNEGLLKTREGRSLTCTKKFAGLNDKNYYVVEVREGDTAEEMEEALRFAPTETRRRREAAARLARMKPDISPEMVAYRNWLSELAMT